MRRLAAILFLVLAARAYALQSVPAYQVSFPTSETYSAIQPSTDDFETVLKDLDAGLASVPSNTASAAATAVVVASNTASIATNTASIATNAADIASIAGAGGSGGVPVGSVLPFAMETEPVGWLECDGAAVSRTTYTNLYAVTGDLHGEGDGSTTFNVPDLRGRFARGWDHTAGNDPDAASRTAPATGGSAGDMVGSVQDDAYESHTHTYSLVDEGYGSGGGPDFGAGNDKDYDGTVTTGDPDSAMGSETRPKNLYMMYCIKY